MARFERRPVLTGIQNPYSEQANATQALRRNFQAFGDFGLRQWEQYRIEDAMQEAGTADIQAGQELELKSPASVYGRAYNQMAKNTYLASTRNAYTKRFNQLALEHPNDSVGFETIAQEYRDSTLSNVPDELQNAIRMDMDASLEKYSNSIRAREAEDAIAAGVIEADNALDGLFNDTIDDIRQGRDEAFLQRRQAYVDMVNSRPELTGSQKLQRIKKLDEHADIYFHMGAVERILKTGNFQAAISYKKKLEQGEYKTFGDSEVARDTVIAEIDKKINSYFQDYNLQEGYDEKRMQIRYKDKANELSRKLTAGEISTAEIKAEFIAGNLDLNYYSTLTTFAKADKTTVTDPLFQWEFTLNVAGMSVAEQKEYLKTEVAKGRVNPNDAAALLQEIDSGKYEVVQSAESKRELNWLRGVMGMDKQLVDLNNSQAMMNAEAYRKAQDMILQGEEPRQAVQQAYAWWSMASSSEVMKSMQNAGIDATIDSRITQARSQDDIATIIDMVGRRFPQGDPKRIEYMKKIQAKQRTFQAGEE